jgi:hypothetical protein
MKFENVFGTKCASAPFLHRPESLGALYKSIIDDYGDSALSKPRPGDEYRKRYKSLAPTDLPTFRRMPEQIFITQPARLFRSSGYKYKGRVYLEAELYWKFEYKYRYANRWEYDWLPVRILSTCYVSDVLAFRKSTSINFWELDNPVQLTLF